MTTMGTYTSNLLFGDGRMTRMGAYTSNLLFGQYYFDTLFPRIPVPVMRLIVENIKKLKLPTKHVYGVTRVPTRGSDDTARRPPPVVKASFSVSLVGVLLTMHQVGTHLLHTTPSSHLMTEIITMLPWYLPSHLLADVKNWLIGSMETEMKTESDMDGARGRDRRYDHDHDQRYN